MNQKHILGLPLLVLFAVVLVACGKPGGEPGKVAEEETVIPVETAIVTRGAVSAAYSGTANLESEEDAEVVARVGGVVEEIFARQGDKVAAGQILAKLDDDRLALELGRAEANLAKLEQEFRRNKELYDRQLISGDVYERLRFEVEAMRADVKLARLQLEFTEIRAPFAGVVADRYIKVGNMVAQNVAAFRITNHDSLRAEIYVPERELNKLRVGQQSTVLVDALPDQRFAGIVERVSPVVDAATGTFVVTVAVEDPQQQLKPGMFGRVNIIYDVHENAVLAPRHAIVAEDAATNVFVVRDGHAQLVSVQTGYLTNGSIEILSGLAEGDQVVTLGQNSLKDGIKVSVINAPANEVEQPADMNAVAADATVAKTNE